jgi:uncharacterized protein with HEPN domain
LRELYVASRNRTRTANNFRAAKTLPVSLRDQAPEIPWTAIIGLGNVLRHDYQHIDDHRLWDVATVHLPQLRPAVMRMLAELEE